MGIINQQIGLNLGKKKKRNHNVVIDPCREMILFHKRVKGQPMQSHRCDFRCVMNSANMTVD